MSPQSDGAGRRAVAPSPAASVEPLPIVPGPPPATRGWRGGRWQRPRLLAPLAVLSPFAAAAWFVLRFDPTDRTVDPTGPCLWHAATGINGPSCGGTRMFYFLIHGNLVEAARHHLPALLAVPFLAYAWLRWTLGRFGVRLPALRLSRTVLIGYGVFFLVFSTVLRNLDWGPLAWFDIENLDPRTQ
jgi:Protein of unknown function (DUF2752)